MQLLAKLKKILYMGFTATLNFQKFKVALNCMDCTKSHIIPMSWNVLETVLSHLDSNEKVPTCGEVTPLTPFVM